jgi:hypothetical protein
MLQLFMEETKWLEAEIEKLRARDIEQQDDILGIRRQLNSSESNANQLTSRVVVLESEIVRAVQDLNNKTAHREAAVNRLSALWTVAVSIANVMLGAGSSLANPLECLRQVPEHLRAQSREVASAGIFLRARQVLTVVRSHLLNLEFGRFAQGFAGQLLTDRRRDLVESIAEVACPIVGSVRVSIVIEHREEQRRAACQAAAKGEDPATGEGAPQQPPSRVDCS